MHETAILLPIARIVKSFGAKGEVVIRYSPETQEDINEKKPVFIYFDGLPVPFYINSIKSRGNDQAVVKFDGIESERDAQEIINFFVHIQPKPGKNGGKKKSTDIFSPTDLVGFALKDENGVLIGSISQFFDYPNNPCISVKCINGKENLIPLHEDFILDFKIKSKEITVSIPKGLLEL